jgi:protein involved in polysaccharide export with SLBB domain
MKLFFTTLLAFFLLTFSSFGQKAKLSGAMQSQAVNAYMKAKQMGLSDAEIKNQLVKRGYPASVLEQVKQVVQSQATVSTLRGESVLDTSLSNAIARRDTNWIFKTPLEGQPKSPYFGYSFFSEAFSEYAPNTNLATPESYILGPGDGLKVDVTGLNEREIIGYISPEGFYTLPYVGKVSLAGVPIEAAKKLIRTRLTAIYPGISSGATKVYVSLSEVRTIQVYVAGEARRPGGYTVSGLTNLFNLLYLSGGPTDNGSLRSIQVIRNNKVIREVDFYEFIKKGILGQNVRLEDQDIIQYPIYKNRVKVEGEVKISSIFELKEKETLQQVLQFAGGFGEKAYVQSVTVKTKGETGLQIKNVPASDFSTFVLMAGDGVTVGAIDSLYENKVMIAGEINRPGPYGLLKNENLSSLIARAGGIKENAFANRGFIQRMMPGVNTQMIPFDVQEILAKKQPDILLVKNDSIVIFSARNFLTNTFVTISGGVKKPGSYSYQKGMKIEDLIALAGGFTVDAAFHKVELNRLKKDNQENLSNQILTRSKVSVDSSLRSSASSLALEPFDDVLVPKLLNYRLLGSVKVRGEVLYEGDYSLEKRDETVSEIIARAGGISPYASVGDLQVYRNGLRIGIEETETPLYLLPGDQIVVPRKNNFVTVTGAVFNEQLIEYHSGRLGEYISAVGGTKNNANLRKAYVQYPNGMYKKTRRFLFMKFYPRIQPGSKIFVPEKSLADMKSIGVAEISSFATLLTSLVAVISILNR